MACGVMYVANNMHFNPYFLTCNSCRGKKIPITLLVSVGCGMDPPKKLGKINIHDSINPKKWIEFLEMLGSAVSVCNQ